MNKKWVYKRIKEVMLVERGGSPRPIQKYLTDSPDGLNWIKISDATASDKYIFQTKQKISKEGLHKTRFVEEGDFILSNSMSFGRPYIMKTTGCIHDGWLVLKEKEINILNKDFLYHLLGSPYIFDQFDKLAAGSTVRNLNIGLVSSVSIPIPPIQEQQQIVEILDEAFTTIDQAKANIEKNIENAKELFQSKLSEIFSQKGENWEEKKLNEICDVKDGTHDSPKYIGEENGIPFITQKNILETGLSFEDIKFIRQEDHENFYKRSNVAHNDVLIAMIGANRGMACLVDTKQTFSIKNVGLIKASENIKPKFLLFYLKSPIATKYIADNSSGSAQGFIGLGKLRTFPVPLPNLTTQDAIVKQLEWLNNEVRVLSNHYNYKIMYLDELKKSLLQKAFSGELTKKEVKESVV